MNTDTTESHSIYIGDKIERAVEIIGEESDETTSWELLNDFADDEVNYTVRLRGNYLNVSVDID